MIPMTAKLNANAPYEDQRAPRARHRPIDATTSGGGTLTSSTSSVIAMAYTPSQNAASLPVPSVNPQLLPHRVDSFLGRLVHHLVRVAGILLVDAHQHEVVKDPLGGHV